MKYGENMDETLRKIQLCELEILTEVTRICEKYKIEYWLAYGTMLGAVRHKGFIPWDDDLDIYMTWQGMKKFEKACNKELNSNYFLQNPSSEKGTGWLFWKVRKNDTFMPEPAVEGKNIHQGIWIDIFPLICLSDNFKKKSRQIKSLIELQKYRFYHNTDVKSIKSIIIDKTVSLKERILWQYVIIMGGVKSKNYLVVGNSFYPKTLKNIDKDTFPRLLFTEKKKYEFEGKLFDGVNDFNGYLMHVYGADYMTPIKYDNHVPDQSKVILCKK